MIDLLKDLNEPQREAVTTIEGPVMVIAGAGSGKTRALTYRVAYMIQEGIDPFSIMALTFTNKAAREMKERIMQLVNASDARNVWMGTFHSIFARILRIEAEKIGFTSNFSIYDTDDSKALINQILKDLNLDTKVYPAKQVLSRISAAKSSLYSPEDYANDPEIQETDRKSNKPLIAQLFKLYNDRLHRANAMDFDDILYFTNILLRDNPDVLYKYQNHFKFILVDEYQDTNYAQYLIVKRIAALFENICVVGDDAQSIYAFRGANIQNILNFKNDYPDYKLIRLEQNYRSTQNIVNASNAVIAHNKDQIKKKVWSDKEKGELIGLIHANSDTEEGTLVANSIFGYKMSRQLANKDFAILYRTNAQSRSMEEALRKQNIPYKIYGGLSFYDRKEIKDLLAYFRVVINPEDEQALLRIINYPVRGIGKTSIERLMVLAEEQRRSIWSCIANDVFPQDFNMGTINKIRDFVVMMKSFQSLQAKMNAFELAKHITNAIGLIKVLKEDDTPEGISRVENVEELLNAIMEFSDRQVDETTGETARVDLVQFMEDVALLTDSEMKKDDPNEDYVSLMTIHSAKGLEFPYVYVVGMEENLFPGILSLSTREELEEERRLFYVAITRAMTKLTLSYAEMRYRYGNLTLSERSRFVDEIDANLIEQTQKASFRGSSMSRERSFGRHINEPEQHGFRNITNTPSSRPAYGQPAVPQNIEPSNPDLLQEGMRVMHAKFGAGTVLSIDGAGANKKASVNFDHAGVKMLMLKFAKLAILKE
ncbi:MAG: UvrD-helicase domain-containing protein [Bacteroidales bacterium]|nr:UvrD-helicase domain-containing protein [Bacteroidales bacterium]MBR0540502.1 UvrD-helicase domain-containing protein [Bacteroidales bacterium]